MDIEIDPEFKALIPPLAPDELAQLEANIIRDGCRDPLVVWRSIPASLWCKECEQEQPCSPGDGNIECDVCQYGVAACPIPILIDGHNRADICERNGITFKVIEMEFDDRDAAEIWIIDNQTGRRNLANIDKVPLLERKREIVAEQAKERLGGRHKNESTVENLPQLDEGKTRDALAAEIGVSGKTYDALRAVSNDGTEELKQAVRENKVGASTAAIISKLPEETQKEIAVLPTRKEIVEETRKHVHVAQNSGENEWYTPPNFIESARLVMGSIDTDPASCEIANRTVKAAQFFTKEDNGLRQTWTGNVWMNPPYAQPLMGNFAEAITYKFNEREFQQGIVLVNNATETQWFQRMAGAASAVCFPKTRVKFLDPEGKPGAPLQGQAIIYFGENKEAFVSEFSQYGATFA